MSFSTGWDGQHDLNMVGDVMDQADGVRGRRGPRARLGVQMRACQLQDAVSATRRVKPEPPPAFPSGVRFGHLNFPVLLMNLPLSLSARIPNNAYMEDLSPSKREICLDRAVAQFLALYKHIAQHAVVFLLPSTPGFQDQPYVDDAGAVVSPSTTMPICLVASSGGAPARSARPPAGCDPSATST